MNQKNENYIGSAFIEPLPDNAEPEFVTVIAILTPSGVDGDVMLVEFPCNEHFDFSPIEYGYSEEMFEPDVMLYNIVEKDWSSDPDVPLLIRWFMLKQKNFINNTEDDLWLLEIDAESEPGVTVVSYRPGDVYDIFGRIGIDDESVLELELV